MSFWRGLLVGGLMGALAVLYMAPRRAARKPLPVATRRDRKGLRLPQRARVIP